LDIGLPILNGIRVAREIRNISPDSKILFVSENLSLEIVDAALQTGAGGYVVKSQAATELLPAVEAVLQGKGFVSAMLARSDSPALTEDAAATTHCHEVAFYADDAAVVDGYARYIESGLIRGDALISVTAKSHWASLFSRLNRDGVDVNFVIEQGRYIPLEAADTLSRLRVGHTLDPMHCANVMGELFNRAATGIKGQHGQVAVCGEIAPMRLSEDDAEMAIQLEHLWDEITRRHGVNTLCGYLSASFRSAERGPIFERICAEHSAVHGRELRNY